jgi:hypothetical protein
MIFGTLTQESIEDGTVKTSKTFESRASDSKAVKMVLAELEKSKSRELKCLTLPMMKSTANLS